MNKRVNRRLVILIAAIACLASAPAAAASTNATLTLDQTAGKTAASAADLGLDLKFTNTGTDSPRDLSIVLPPGLLANASIDGGACLRNRSVTGTACKVTLLVRGFFGHLVPALSLADPRAHLPAPAFRR